MGLFKAAPRGVWARRNSTGADPSYYVEFTQTHMHIYVHTDVYNICAYTHTYTHTHQESTGISNDQYQH